MRRTSRAALRARLALASRVGLCLVMVALASGCAQISPYERGKLAHPTMGASDMSGYAESHVRAVQEGATGGASGSGSGCGCN